VSFHEFPFVWSLSGSFLSLASHASLPARSGVPYLDSSRCGAGNGLVGGAYASFKRLDNA